MKLAAVGFSDDSGVGRELVSAVRQLPFTCVYIVPDEDRKARVDLLPISACYLPKGTDPAREMHRFLDLYRPDAVLTWEGPGHTEFPGIWKSKGVRWVNVVHWDWFNPRRMEMWRTAELISPNTTCQKMLSQFHLKSKLLPVPVDTERFQFRKRKQASVFMSVYGRGGPHNRRSLPEIFLAWSEMAYPPLLRVKAQEKPIELNRYLLPASVKVEVDNLPEPEDLYLTGDVSIQLSRYEGIGISLLEAMACGLPVITTDAAPMNEISPDLCIQVEETSIARLADKEATIYTPSVGHLREVIEELADRDLEELSLQGRRQVEKKYSWTALRWDWLNYLSR